MPKLYEKRADGKIWYANRWWSEEALKRNKEGAGRWASENKERLAALARGYYREHREKNLERVKEYYESHKEQRNEYCKEYKKRNPEKTKKQRNDSYARTNPTRGLTRTISDYRRGKISGDELAQRLRDAFARGDELCERIEQRRKQSKPKL